MFHSSLHSAISHITGDSVATIKRLGFRLNRRSHVETPVADDPLAVVDCPCCGGTVVVAWNRKDPLDEFADCRRCETVFPYSSDEVYEQDLMDVPVPEPRAYARAA